MINKLVKSIDEWNKCNVKCDLDKKYINEWNKRRDYLNKYLMKNIKNLDIIAFGKKNLEDVKKSKIVIKYNKCILKLCKLELKNLVKSFIPILKSELKDNKNPYKENILKKLKKINKWNDDELNNELYKLALKKPNFLY